MLLLKRSDGSISLISVCSVSIVFKQSGSGVSIGCVLVHVHRSKL